MLECNMDDTPLLQSESRQSFPREEEFFALTVALLVVHNAAYSDLRRFALELTIDNFEDVASCLERHVPCIAADLGAGQPLRERLEQFVGLRISNMPVEAKDECTRPT